MEAGESKMTAPTSHPNSVSEIEHQPMSSLKEELDLLSSEQHRPTIYKVHNGLRNANNEAYEPCIVAIGPYHSHKHSLKKMKIHKLHNLNRLLQRYDKRIEHCVAVMAEFEPEARKCYAEPITLSPREFTEMLVLDGCFIIEFFSKFIMRAIDGCSSVEYDYTFEMSWASGNVCRDLLLFENQLPFFILYQLLHFMDASGQAFRYIVEVVLAIYGMRLSLDRQFGHIQNPTNLKHLLELIHKSLVLPSQESSEGEQLDFIGGASSLVESNVKFQKTDISSSMFQMNFGKGSMQMRNLFVEDNTESYFRNLIAYEQYFLEDTKHHVGDYAKLMDCLINTPEDVKLLMECGIIENWLGSENEVAQMFNKLCDGVMISKEYFIYKGEFKKVNEHCNRRWNKWMAILKHNHFNSPWAILSIVAAITLLLLTFVQTLFSIIN